MPGPKEVTRFDGAERRLTFVNLGVIAAFSLLCLQFWQLQVVESHTFEEMAKANTIREMTLKAPRGTIVGHNGVVLADNRPSADVMFVPGDCPQERREAVCQRLEQLLGVPAEEVLKDIEQNRSEPFTQILIKSDISKTDRFRLEELSFELPGVLTVVSPQRRYPYGKTAGQILGYLNEISQTQLDSLEGEYRLGDLVGQLGVEKSYEADLRGEDGFMLATKFAKGLPQFRTNRLGVPTLARQDSIGHVLELENAKSPVAGNDIALTLDIELQSFCENLLGQEVGAIVVLEAETGAVRALASTPTFDPAVFVSGRIEERAALLKSKEEMLNRAYRELYPPGSIFKVMMAAAALEEKVISSESSFYCGGGFYLPGTKARWGCWSSGHGSVNVVQALAYSCDVFFYNVGLKLGIERLVEYSHKMGLGVKTGIDLPQEEAGLIPSPEWKAEFNKKKPVWEQRWRDGDTVNASIGQGSVSTTPLQSAVMMASILNGGRRVRPFLSMQTGPQLSEPFLSESTVNKVIEGMLLCVNDHVPPSGTGKEAFIKGFDILGKTGTAQVVRLAVQKQYGHESNIPKHLRDHAWFVAGVSNREPKIAICILVEHGLHGSSAAAPLAKDVINFFYTHHAPSLTPEAPVVQLAQDDR